jgi:hypothetical protein
LADAVAEDVEAYVEDAYGGVGLHKLRPNSQQMARLLAKMEEK